MFWGTFFEELHGMEDRQLGVLKGYDASMFRDYAPDVKSFLEAKEIPNAVTVCVSKIQHPGHTSNARELEVMKANVPEDEWKNIKITVISPSWYHFRYRAGRAYPKEVYANDEEYFADVAKAYQTELKLLHEAGIRNVQIDDPNLAYFCSEAMLSGWKADSGNTKTADEMFDAYVKFYNACFERPADMHLGIHLCRGNYMGSRHFSEGAYDNIASKLFKDLNVDTYYLEYDTARAGGFEPLKHLPKNKNVILGVVTSKFPELEDKEKCTKLLISLPRATGSRGRRLCSVSVFRLSAVLLLTLRVTRSVTRTCARSCSLSEVSLIKSGLASLKLAASA